MGGSVVGDRCQLCHRRLVRQMSCDGHEMAGCPVHLDEANLEDKERLVPLCSDLVALLMEWNATPFFESRIMWNKWISDFGKRVKESVALATNVIEDIKERDKR